MMFWTIVEVALRSLAANKLRSFLAMLGIIIGVWSVISALALASGAQKKVVDQMSSLGTNVIMVTPGQRGSGGVISGTQKKPKGGRRPGDAEDSGGRPRHAGGARRRAGQAWQQELPAQPLGHGPPVILPFAVTRSRAAGA